MPRTRVGIPAEQLEIEEDLRERHGGAMTALDVGRELGLSKYTSYNAWLSDVPSIDVNGRKRYRVRDVAEKLYRGMSA